MKQSKVRIIIPLKWKYDFEDDELVAIPPDSDIKIVFVSTSYHNLEDAFDDATLGFEKILSKKDININGMPAIYCKARDVYDVSGEQRTFDWLYILFKSPSGYVVTMCAGADTRSDLFFKYYIDINMIYKTIKPIDNLSTQKRSRENTDKKKGKSKK